MKKAALKFALFLFAPSAIAETHFSVYGGLQENFDSQAQVKDVDGSHYPLNISWQGRSFSMPIYYGFRLGYDLNTDWQLAIDYTHTKAYSTDQSRSDSGYSTLEFTDGINILTLDAIRQFDTGKQWTPYLGAGLGVTIPHVELQSPAMQGKTFEYQLAGPAATAFGGIDYELSSQFSVFSELKFDYHSIDAQMLDPLTNQSGSFETDILSYAVNMGVKLSF